MTFHNHIIAASLLAFSSIGFCARAEEENAGCDINWGAEAIFSASSSSLAPYYMASNRHGILTQGKNSLLRVSAFHEMDTTRRFSYAFGADIYTGYSNSTDYLRFDAAADQWAANAQHPARLWLQQLYGEVKYRGVFLSVGMKEHGSALLNNRLSSGDLVESGNARPIPEVRVGFIDFQNIPFTRGWVQIQGEISYGKFMDKTWNQNHYNYYTNHINRGALYSYKRCYFRTKPSERFSATFGMQVGAMFGGTTDFYSRGELVRTESFSRGVKQFFKMFIPTDGGVEYYTGSTLGSWEVLLRYRLRNGWELKGYMQKPYEDGSGIGFLNGFDGLWGLELDINRRGPVKAAVIEYVDFHNQSGPTHWDPDDVPGTTITSRAEGGDDYYNNHEYNSYQNYGMAIGTPFMVSPLYNLNGNLTFLYNRLRGFNAAVEGDISRAVSYRLMGSYRRSWGNGFIPLIQPKSATSVMGEIIWDVTKIKGLSVKGQIAFDRGELLGNNFGALLSLTYSGNFSL